MKKLVFNFKSKDTKKIKFPKNILGGKGANLAEMGRLGYPVPSGFTISTEVCDLFYKNNKIELTGTTDPGLFKNEFEKILYKKIHQIRKDFTNIRGEGDYEELLEILASVKNELNEFFDNVIVNDQDELIKKNRLELLQMLCKTFDNYLNFSKIESMV